MLEYKIIESGIEYNIVECSDGTKYWYLNGKNYKEIIHYSDIPEIGKLIDYNREDRFYIDLFKKHKFKLTSKRELNDSGFIANVFVFQKD